MTEMVVNTINALTTIAVAIYGLLLVIGGMFDKSPQWANEYARWLGRFTLESIVGLIVLTLTMIFGKKKKGKGRRRR